MRPNVTYSFAHDNNEQTYNKLKIVKVLDGFSDLLQSCSVIFFFTQLFVHYILWNKINRKLLTWIPRNHIRYNCIVGYSLTCPLTPYMIPVMEWCNILATGVRFGLGWVLPKPVQGSDKIKSLLIQKMGSNKLKRTLALLTSDLRTPGIRLKPVS